MEFKHCIRYGRHHGCFDLLSNGFGEEHTHAHIHTHHKDGRGGEADRRKGMKRKEQEKHTDPDCVLTQPRKASIQEIQGSSHHPILSSKP